MPSLENLEDRTVLSTTFDPGTATWFVRNAPSAGPPDSQFQYGAPGWTAVTGDWNGSGKLGIGVYDPKTATWYLRNENSAGAPDAGAFQFGAPGWIPITGDWDGSGHTGIGVFDPTTGTFYLRNEASAGAPDAGSFQYGAPGWVPVTGDWTGSGHTGIGVYNPTTATWYLRNETSAGAPDAGAFQYGAPGWTPVTGNWNGGAVTGIGAINPTTSSWYLRLEPNAGPPDAGSFQFGGAGWQPVVGNPGAAAADPPAVTASSPSTTAALTSASTGLTAAATSASPLITLNLKPLDINLLGLEVQTNQIQVTVSAQSGNGQLLGNLLSDVANLLNLQGVNNALNNVLGSVVDLLNSASLTVSGVNPNGPLTNAPAATTPVLSLNVAPVHLNLLGALVDTSPIQLTITAHSGPGLVLGNVVADLANLFNPPLPSKLNLDYVNGQLTSLINKLNAQIPGIGGSPTTPPTVPSGSEQVVSLTVPPINVNLLGLILQTSQIQVNANAQTGNGDLLGNVLTDLLNTLGATPQNLADLSNNLSALLGKVVGVLNASSLVLPSGALGSLSQVLQTLALPNLINSTGTATAPVLNLAIASPNATTPPVNVNLLGLQVTTSNIQAQLLAQTGNGQVLGNLVYNVANLLNPGGSLNLLTILNELGL